MYLSIVLLKKYMMRLKYMYHILCMLVKLYIVLSVLALLVSKTYNSIKNNIIKNDVI
uniref:Uncharacterized protein n=1 Tax=Clostridium argentinense TaxID=29341 RepID=A0A7I6N4Q3_9CLOT|nr:hypothetical protein [Clostridium argentinense]